MQLLPKITLTISLIAFSQWTFEMASQQAKHTFFPPAMHSSELTTLVPSTAVNFTQYRLKGTKLLKQSRNFIQITKLDCPMVMFWEMKAAGFHSFVHRKTLPPLVAPARWPNMYGCAANRHGTEVISGLFMGVVVLLPVDMTSIALFIFPMNR